jgi:hypothetical protein
MAVRIARLLHPDYTLWLKVTATPICGEDFCDACGDCLHCYDDDPCYGHGTGGEHTWVVYAEDGPEWRQHHPERDLPPIPSEGGMK